MQLRESFRKFSPREKMLWAYSYAGALMGILDDCRMIQGGRLDYC